MGGSRKKERGDGRAVGRGHEGVEKEGGSGRGVPRKTQGH